MSALLFCDAPAGGCAPVPSNAASAAIAGDANNSFESLCGACYRIAKSIVLTHARCFTTAMISAHECYSSLPCAWMLATNDSVSSKRIYSNTDAYPWQSQRHLEAKHDFIAKSVVSLITLERNSSVRKSRPESEVPGIRPTWHREIMGNH